MKVDNIVEICVPLIIGIMSIAYPILGGQKNRIGEKYKADYLLNVFESFGPQRNSVCKRFSIFEFGLILTIFSFILIIFSFSPWECIKQYPWLYDFLGNSAYIIVLGFTTYTFILFIQWTSNIMLYTGKITFILKELIERYSTLANKRKQESDQDQNYLLKSINSLAIYAIKEDESHLTTTLNDFYYEIFKKEQRHQKFKVEGVEYPEDLYELIFNIIIISKNKKTIRLGLIEKNAVSGYWLLDFDSTNSVISERTYNSLWYNVVLMEDNIEMLKIFWKESSYYIEIGFSYPYYNYSENLNEEINNLDERRRQVDERRNRFLEMFVVFGGLQLHGKNYEMLGFMFTYSRSSPPLYYLFPVEVDKILFWLDYFLNERDNFPFDINARYMFPSYDNYGVSYKVKNEVIKYLALLFIRVHTQQYFRYINYEVSYNLQNLNTVQLERIKNGMKIFKKLVSDNLNNQSLMNYLCEDWDRKTILQKVDDLENTILRKIRFNKLVIKGKNIDKQIFKNESLKTITNSFEEYSCIMNKGPISRIDESVNTKIEGFYSEISKEVFIQKEIERININDTYAVRFKNNVLYKKIPESFHLAATKTYIVELKDLLDSLAKIIPNKDQKIIVMVGDDILITELIESTNFKDILCKIPSSKYCSQKAIYILDKNNLPKFIFENPLENVSKKISELDYSIFKKMSSNYEIYTAVVDFGDEGFEEIRKHYNILDEDELDDRIFVFMLLKCIIQWSKSRNIVELKIVTPYAERGIPNSLDEIDPL